MPLIILLFLVGLVMWLAPYLIGLAALVIAAWLVGKSWAWWADGVAARRRADAELCARADQQHRWILAGDDRGVFGMYPPAVK